MMFQHARCRCLDSSDVISICEAALDDTTSMLLMKEVLKCLLICREYSLTELLKARLTVYMGADPEFDTFVKRLSERQKDQQSQPLKKRVLDLEEDLEFLALDFSVFTLGEQEGGMCCYDC